MIRVQPIFFIWGNFFRWTLQQSKALVNISFHELYWATTEFLKEQAIQIFEPRNTQQNKSTQTQYL